MNKNNSFQLRSIIFPSKAGVHCIQDIYPSEKPASTKPVVTNRFNWITALQYFATREEAEEKEKRVFKAAGATDFKNRPRPVVSPTDYAGVPELDPTGPLDFGEWEV
jgi:hypothetical protein